MSGLKGKQARFVTEYAKDQNATQAAIRAGYAPKTARQMGAENLTKPVIRQALAELLGPVLAAREAEAVATAEEVTRSWSRQVRADVTELVEYRRGACRWCWGTDHRYQFTAPELEQARGEHQEVVAEAMRGARSAAMLKAIPQFDPQGGDGYNANREPHPECPSCFGDGVGRALIADTRTLSPEARELYAGVKVTRDGVEVKLNDKATALAALAKFHRIAGHTAAEQAEGAQPTVHLHLHLMKVLGDLPPDERAVARKLLTMLNGQGVIEGEAK